MSGESEKRTVIKGNASKYVKLNVGGTLFYTTIGTLTKYDSMLKAMFSGRLEVLTDSEGWVLIDRCGTHFGKILNFLRDGDVCLPESKRELLELQAEAKYFLVQELVTLIETRLNEMDRGKDVVSQHKSNIILTKLPNENQRIIMNSDKPVIKLTLNRHNNKYSYTNNSDDNLLRHVELFDKLALRYGHRLTFIKQVLSGNEICQWSFHGQGQKIAEICCTSIVYGQDKKNTKVEFPDARIWEETCNLSLFESSDKADTELLALTRGPGGAGASYPSDEEEEPPTPPTAKGRRR